MWALSIAFQGALAALAWRLARERPAHRSVALFVTGAVGADVLRRVLAILILEPVRAAHLGPPYVGLARAVFHMDEALFLLWPFALAALACAVFLRGGAARRGLIALGGLYVVAVAIASAAYPTLRQLALARFYLATELLAVAVWAWATLAWWRRHDRPTLTDLCVLVFGFLQLGAVLRWDPARSWDWQLTIYAIAHGALAALHMGEVWTGSRPRSAA